jgi:hypothetical protein
MITPRSSAISRRGKVTRQAAIRDTGNAMASVYLSPIESASRVTNNEPSP